VVISPLTQSDLNVSGEAAAVIVHNVAAIRIVRTGVEREAEGRPIAAVIWVVGSITAAVVTPSVITPTVVTSPAVVPTAVVTAVAGVTVTTVTVVTGAIPVVSTAVVVTMIATIAGEWCGCDEHSHDRLEEEF
jgi:hypothetical protein